MGSEIEINDTLQLTESEGFPKDVLDLNQHSQNPVSLSSVSDRVFHFKNRPGARLFHLDPIRVFLVENIDGKWLFWGKVVIQSQTIGKDPEDKNKWVTSGSYKFVDIYEPDYQKSFTIRESKKGKSYF